VIEDPALHAICERAAIALLAGLAGFLFGAISRRGK
jgi:hypothetical protein